MLFGIASAPVAAQTQARPALQPVAILTVISGDVLMRTAAGDFTSVMDGAVLYVGNVLRTSADARALITLFEGSTVELDPASDVVIEDARGGSTIAQALGRGLRVVMHLTTADSRYEPTAPAATASVRGIEFEIAVANGSRRAADDTDADRTPRDPTVAIPTSIHLVAPTETTTAQANTTSVTSSSSRGERVPQGHRRDVVRARTTEKSRDDDRAKN